MKILEVSQHRVLLNVPTPHLFSREQFVCQGKFVDMAVQGEWRLFLNVSLNSDVTGFEHR